MRADVYTWNVQLKAYSILNFDKYLQVVPHWSGTNSYSYQQSMGPTNCSNFHTSDFCSFNRKKYYSFNVHLLIYHLQSGLDYFFMFSYMQNSFLHVFQGHSHTDIHIYVVSS